MPPEPARKITGKPEDWRIPESICEKSGSFSPISRCKLQPMPPPGCKLHGGLRPLPCDDSAIFGQFLNYRRIDPMACLELEGRVGGKLNPDSLWQVCLS